MAPITIATLTIKLILALAHWSDEQRTHHEEMSKFLLQRRVFVIILRLQPWT